MKQIVHHEQCKRCGECCRFRADRQDFAPIFTAGEIEAIRAVRGEMPEFVPFKDSDNIFQIRLVEAQQPTPHYPYVCPFLDEDNYACSIYDVRPFDCRVWPFIILKETETGEIRLAHFTGNACLAMQEVSPEDLSEYEAYMQEWVTSEDFLNFLREHPQLIWENSNDGRYMTIPSKDLTQILAQTFGA
jgi:Fe-S-cluster containining protein